ncbi:class II glutamine amidotransferase [Mycobacterium sp. M1]|uniref:Class II glutamine amidotransferase n=1 Tax=Mycolicibacter acidiphilus TaxID=2835306 RepID=A0ABS5RMX7_9MYCO|nr:class II glutamine amidotransferase [Mycolicibacter acidiphilus]MBS9535665.1 class II glutamine amidotransferase [Mycolicibacter acidiphilus]
MCRLFGLHVGTTAATATFWLLGAPDNLIAQSRRNPEGAGLGVFDAQGHPHVYKQPMAAWRDADFATEAHELTGTTFVAHVRYATTGALDVVNTHPFCQDGRIFAHNGVVEGLDAIDARLRELGAADLVAGQTDSERVFALITAETRSAAGDVTAGLTAAVRWLAAAVPIYALNVLLSTATDLWALRYPDTHGLYLLDRRDGAAPYGLSLYTQRIRAESEQLRGRPAVVFASEPMDTDPRWQLIAPGELVHVGPDLTITRDVVFPDPPVRRMRREDLSAAALAAQHPNA